MSSKIEPGFSWGLGLDPGPVFKGCQFKPTQGLKIPPRPTNAAGVIQRLVKSYTSTAHEFY